MPELVEGLRVHRATVLRQEDDVATAASPPLEEVLKTTFPLPILGLTLSFLTSSQERSSPRHLTWRHSERLRHPSPPSPLW